MENAIAQSLELMWKGMVSIFVVIGAIFLVTFVMTRIGKKRAKAEQAAKQEADQP